MKPRLRVYSLSLLFSLLLPITVAAESARQVLQGSDLAALKPSDQLIVSGVNQGSAAAIVVIRIDDSYRPAYADRVNIERVVPPGQFSFELSLGGLFKPSGEPLRLTQLRQVIVFPGRPKPPLVIAPLAIKATPVLPTGAHGWDLGSASSTLWPGFERMDLNFFGIQGGKLVAIDRGRRQQATEGLTTDGIRGIANLSLPLKPGRWFITLWLQDRGEWEYLPHPLQRRIKANGAVVLEQQITPQQWIEQDYLRGSKREYQPGDSVWDLYGNRSEGRISFAVEVAAEGLQLAFSGHMPEAGFVSAIIAERDDGYATRDQVRHALKDWWTANWRISDSALKPLSLALTAKRDRITVARGTSGTLELTLNLPNPDAQPRITLKPPAHASESLPSTLRWGRWQLRRTTLSSTLLHPVDTQLRSSDGPPASNGLPRRLHIQIDVPDNAPAGQYQGALQIDIDGGSLHHALIVDVPAIDLPAADRPIGVYLERPVHFGWFKPLAEQADAALSCDLNFLHRIGLSGISPGLSTPQDLEGSYRLVDEMLRVQQAGFVAPFLAYAPFKRLLRERGIESAVMQLKQTDQLIRELKLPDLAWSIADEPSNPGRVGQLDEIARYANAYTPNTLLAGHLNDRVDRPYLPLLDIALINSGFGVDIEDIDRVRAAGATPWFYNMESRRAAAGFYLWRTGVKGYLQWHARMPTAAPFDPTDGREDDVQFLYPTPQACPPALDVDITLFEIVEGINDLRWLLWLEAEAINNQPSARLLERIRAQIPTHWQAMQQISDQQLDAWRKAIIEVANRSEG